jgi:hypothetical protein
MRAIGFLPGWRTAKSSASDEKAKRIPLNRLFALSRAGSLDWLLN